MQKVIGLDIGSYSIKAIEIVNTFKSYEVLKFYEVVIPVLEGVPMETIAPVCMEQLFKENNLHADRILTAMPGQFISSRIIPFNFSDARKIEQSIAVELEDVVPFNMDDMIIDQQILGTVNDKTMVLAVMTRKAFLRNFLDSLSRIQIDPKLVDVDSLAFYNLSAHLNAPPDKNVALVDMGHDKTTVCIVRNGLLRMFRSFNLGGRSITEFLARDLEISYQEAQRAKHRVSKVFHSGYNGADLEPGDRDIGQRMTLAANSIVKELGRTLYSYKTWDRDPIAQIYLSGGTSRAEGLDQLLAEQLEVPTEVLDLRKADLKISDEVAANRVIMPQSLSIGLRAVSTVKKHSQINLRKGEFAYVQNYESIMKVATKSLKALSLVMALLMVSYVIKHYFYSKQTEIIQAQFKKEYLAIFPDQSKKFKGNMTFSKIRKDAESGMRQGINEKKSAVQEFVNMNKGSGALVLLQEISNAIPKEVSVDVTQFEFKSTVSGDGKLTFRAETDNFASQAKIMDAIKGVHTLTNVEEKSSGSKPGSDGKIIEFTVQANYNPQAETM